MQSDSVVITSMVIAALSPLIAALVVYIRDKGTRAHLSAKIDQNTDVSVKAFDAANHINEKIAGIATDRDGAILAAIQGLKDEIAALKAKG